MKILRSTGAIAAVAAAMLSQNASAVNLATDGVGEVAIAPYYTVRDGWSTLINLTNTTDSPIVVKVRFHEGINSRDVLDFNVALSAFDVFTGVVRENANGIAEFAATDQPNEDGLVTCTIPSAVATTPQRLNPLGFSGGTGTASNDDGGIGGDNTNFSSPNAGAITRLSEGYIEFVVMGYADEDFADASDPVTWAAGNVGLASANTGNTITAAQIGAINVARAIEQHDCASLDLAFNDAVNPNSGNRYILDTARQMGEPINALKFNFRLLNGARGTEAGNVATTWANFFNPVGGPDAGWEPLDDSACTITRGDYRQLGVEWSPDDAGAIANGGSCNNLLTAQTQYPFLEPSLNDAFPTVANWFDDGANALTTVTADATSLAADGRARGIDAVSATIQRAAVLNEWSSNSALGVTTDWIITMPTKGFYVDQGQGQQFAVTLNDSSVPAGSGNGRPEACIAIIAAGAYETGYAALLGAAPTGGVDFDDDGVLDCEAVPYPPFARAFDQVTAGDRTTASSCNEIGFVFFDRAEQTVTAAPPGVIVSPAPPPVVDTDSLCYEANVVTFNGGSALDPQNEVNVDTSALDAEAGWMFVTLANEDAAGLDAVTDGTQSGLPVIGFNLKQRNFGDVTKNFSSSIDHGYLRD
ncbi:MAG: hypothetical protein AB1651_06965 [Pseudomonadota bacterium]